MRKTLMMAAAAAALATAGSANAAPTLFAGNGHYYEYIAGVVTWQQALAAAAAATPMAGYTSYLATITSADEDNFVANVLTNNSIWLAGSDEAVEGEWRWVAGPEAGQQFWSGGSGGTALLYTNWNGGEPNNSGNEDYLHTNINQGNWNDVFPTHGTSGYVVEYSAINAAVPEPATWAMMLLGFLGVGTVLRRGQSRQTVRVRYT